MKVFFLLAIFLRIVLIQIVLLLLFFYQSIPVIKVKLFFLCLTQLIQHICSCLSGAVKLTESDRTICIL